MIQLVRQSGQWGWLLLLLLVVILGLTLQAVIRLRRARRHATARTLHGINAILFWGGVSVALGFLGQFSGLYLALATVSHAEKISPSMVAAGFADSLAAPTLGLALGLLSVLLWLALRASHRVVTRDMLRCLGLGLITFGLASVVSAQGPAGRLHSAEHLRQDFDTLRALVEKHHPALCRYHDRPTVDATFDRARAKIIKEMSELEFMILLAPVIDQLHCGHTQLAFSREFLTRELPNLRAFPFRLRIFDGRAYVVADYSGHANLPRGTEILAVDDEPFPDVLEKMLVAARGDGLDLSGKLYFLNNQPFGLHGVIPRTDTYLLRYRRPGGTRTECVSVPGRAYRALYSAYQRERKSRDSAPFALKMLGEQSTAVLTIKAFVRTRQCDPTVFLRTAFAEVAKRGIRHLIIDVRGNSGGQPQYAADLVAYLMDVPFTYFARAIPSYARLARPMDPHETHFAGTVHVLIDGGCFSTTGHFLSLVKYHKRARLIGETAGSTFSCNDNGTNATLPNTRIRVRVPRSVFETSVEGFEPGRGIRPDHEVKQSIEDYLLGVDTVMEYALQQIRSATRE